MRKPGQHGDYLHLNEAEIVRLYVEDHLTLREIAARFSCKSEAPIRLRLKRNGVQFRHYTESQRLRRMDGIPTRHRGSRRKMIGGYVLIRTPFHPDANVQGYVMEHRLVMEQTLGRRLLSTEEVHHRNGVKTDNRPENLQVVSRDEHAAIHAVSHDQALAIMHEAAMAYGQRPTYQFMQLTHRRLGPVLRVFGTWKQALIAAGFDPPRTGARPKASA